MGNLVLSIVERCLINDSKKCLLVPEVLFKRFHSFHSLIFVNNLYQLYTNLCNHIYISRLQLVVVVTLTCHNYASYNKAIWRQAGCFV